MTWGFERDADLPPVYQSPSYSMQFMLGIYEFADGPALRSPADRYPKEFVIDWFRGYRPRERRA
jgi:hypothetical protein